MGSKFSIFAALIILNISIVGASVIEVSLDYDYVNNVFTLNSTKMHNAYLPGGIRDESGYRWELFSVNGLMIQAGDIVPPGQLIVENLHPNESPILVNPNKSQVSIFLVYDPKVKSLIVYTKSSEVLNVDLMQYNHCNLDHICNEDENWLLCPEDCPRSQKDGVCQNIEDGKCDDDPDCNNRDPDCIFEENKGVKASDGQDEEITTDSEDGRKGDKSAVSMTLVQAITFFGILILFAFIFLVARKKN